MAKKRVYILLVIIALTSLYACRTATPYDVIILSKQSDEYAKKTETLKISPKYAEKILREDYGLKKPRFSHYYGLVGHSYFWCKKSKTHMRLRGFLVNGISGKVFFIDEPNVLIEPGEIISIKNLKIKLVRKRQDK